MIPSLTFSSASDILNKALCPEDVFDDLAEPKAEALKIAYRRLARVVHPDRNGSNGTATGWKKEACAIWFHDSWEGARWTIPVDREAGSEKQSRSGTVTVERVIEFLNDALALDPRAVTALVEQRVPCNRALQPSTRRSPDNSGGLVSKRRITPRARKREQR